MENKRPEMIIFDVGGTLFNDGKFDAESGFDALRLLACNSDAVTTDLLIKSWNKYLGKISESGNQLEISLSSALKYVEMNTGLCLDISMHKQEEIFDRHNSTRNVIDGVEELLCVIKSLGIHTAVISNNMMSGESLALALKYWIPESDFEFCLTSADLLFKKPDNSLFETALKFAGLKADDCIYCGDGLVPDVYGASACGMTAVLLDSKSETEFEIRKYENYDYIAVNNWNVFAKHLLDGKEVLLSAE